MRRILATSLAVLLASAAQARDPAALSAAALHDDLAFDITEGLTTEIGERKAGSDAEARARQWAVARLKSLGFANVHIEPFDIPYWVRGQETGAIVSPFPQRLVLTALWNSSPTPPGGLTAEVVAFDSLDALKAAPAKAVAGKIVFVDHRMTAAEGGEGYGYYGGIRRSAPGIASSKGAAAIVIRSLGTDEHRNPHAGTQDLAGNPPIPAAALSVPDAQQLARVLKRGKPVVLRLDITAHAAGTAPSGNVIAEIPGRDPKAGVIVIGGHLDSWDLGTGAIDDASGVAITTAAAKRIMDSGRPLHTIRLIWFGSEEIGLFGGKAYWAKYSAEKHALTAESDLGADKIFRFDSRLGAGNAAVVARVAAALQPLGIPTGLTDKAGGSDIEPLIDAGVPVIELQQDATRYFDYHHTPDDTLDKVDLGQLRQNVAAWTAMLAVVADAPEL